MSSDLAVAPPATVATPTRRSPVTAVAARSARSAVRSGALWGLLLGVVIASSAVSYTKIYKTAASRDALAATYGHSQAMSALFGPAPNLQTVTGFTDFKVTMTLMILGAVWGLLTSTRLLRGEEDRGRWDLLVAGQTTRRRATAQAIAGLGAGAAVLWIVTALVTIVGWHGARVHVGVVPSLYFALAKVAAAVMFLAVGAVTSQLAATRRQAAASAAVVLGVSYALRLLADAGVGLHALIWVTPLGWVEELRPLTAPRPSALVPIAVFTFVLCGVAVQLAGRRDVGASIVADRTHAEAHLRLLTGPAGLAVRLLRATIIGWWVAIALAALLYGLIAKSAGTAISGSVHEVFAKLGAVGSGADAVLGLCFLVLAILIGFVAAGQVTAARAEESEGMLDHFLVRPVSRWSWLAARSVVALGVMVVAGLAAGLFAWLGAATQHSGLSVVTLLGAGINLVPPSMVILGVGVLAFGIRPRVTSWAVYGLLGWSLLLVVVGGIGAVSHWVLDTSVFHQMASAPAVAPHWEANAIMAAVGIAAALVGGWAFRHRDVQGE
jgi:ABC-2 type transport system permease protein